MSDQPETRTLRERLQAAGLDLDRAELDVIENEVGHWLLGYVGVGLDPTEPLAELEGK